MSLAQHLPALQVVLPLISAPLAVLLRRGGLAFAIVTAAAWAAFAIAIALFLLFWLVSPEYIADGMG